MQTGASEEKAVRLLDPGDMFGDYTVEKLLGQGGMGAVYLVRAPGGERYAVKVMFPDMVKKGSDYRKRFAREAEFAMQIHHKNLISVYDVGEDPETGLCYIIMDYVPGGSVADRLENNGPLPMAEAVSIAAQVALALEVAHRHGVIHRDIKPENIMFDADGTPKLADLGVAKFTDEAHKTTVTTTGMIIGTPAYMAPEQMMDSHHVDARADIYALGVVLYEMLTGKRPNEGSTAVELLAKAIKGEPLPDVRTMRPEISAAVAHVLSLMCAPKPEGRPATALAAAHLLQKAATGRLVLPKKPPRAADAAARKKKRGMPWALLAVCAVVCALGAAVVASLLNKPPPQVLRQPVVITNVTEQTVILTNTVDRVASGHLPGSDGQKWRPGPTSKWFVEWDKALAESRRTGKAMFLLSTGSDWCHWCTKLADEVLDTPEFSQFADQNLVLLYLDSPSRNPLCREQRLHNKLVVKTLPFGGGVPFALIVNAKGEKLGEIRGGGQKVGDYLERLRGICSARGETIPGGDAQALFADGYAKLADAIAARRAALPPVSTNDFKAALTGVAVVDGAKVHGSKEDIKFLSPETELEVPYGKSALFRVEYDFPKGYGARIWTRDEWPAAERRNSYYFGSNPSGMYSGKGTAYGFLSMLARGSECTLKSLAIRTNSDPELDERPQGWTIGTTAVNLNFKAKDSSPVVPYVSKTRLHALYRSKDRKHVFVEVCHMNESVTYVTPRCTVDRLREVIDGKIDILFVSLACSKDGVLFAANDPGDKADLAKVSNGSGRFGEHSAAALKKLRVRQAGRLTAKSLATFEELLQIGKGHILFKIDHRLEYATELEALLEKLDAWESVILQISNGKNLSQKYGARMLEKMKSGQLIVSCVKGSFPPVQQIIPEATADASYRDRMREQNLKGIRQRIFASMVLAERTDDEAGWEDALNDGVTVLRTGRPRALLQYIERDKRRTSSFAQSRKEISGRSSRQNVSSTVLFPILDRSPVAWAYSFEEEEGWTGGQFNDSRWKRAPGGFGYREDLKQLPRARLNTDWQSDRLFLRKRFDWAGGNVSRVVVDAYHDDDVTFYLNGQLMLNVNGANFDWQPFEIPAERFLNAVKSGENVFCAEVRDLGHCRYFDCGLVVECGGKVDTHVGSDSLRRVKTAVGTWTVVVENGVAQLGDGRNVALEPRPKGYLKIPAELDGIVISRLAHDSFLRCEELEGVEIAEGMRSIGEGAFCGCSQLARIELPSTLEHIGPRAMQDTRLEKIDLKNVRLMEEEVFRYCDRLENIKASSCNVKFRVKDGVLYDVVRRAVVFCPTSRKVYAFPSGIEEICNSAFRRTKLKKVVIPETVEFVGWDAFRECPFLENVTFKGDDAIIRGGAFSDNPLLKTVVLPKRLKALDDWAIFNHAGQLESVVLPDTVEIIDDAVFENCPKLKRVILGKSLRTVRHHAFSGCPNLLSVAFPPTLREMGAEVFLDCSGLKKVSFAGNAPDLKDQGSDRFGKDLYKGANPSLVTFASKDSTGWMDGSDKLPKVWPVDGGESARPIRHVK